MSTEYPTSPFPLNELTAAVHSGDYSTLPKLGLRATLHERMFNTNLRFLHQAASHGNLPPGLFSAEDLLNCLTFDASPIDALHFATRASLQNIVDGVTIQQLERSKQGDAEDTALIMAIDRGQLPYITKPISAHSLAKHIGHAGWTALHAAVQDHRLFFVSEVTTQLLRNTKQRGNTRRTAYDHLTNWAIDNLSHAKQNHFAVPYVEPWLHPLYAELFRDDPTLAIQIATTISQDWPLLRSKATLWLARILAP